VLGIQKQTPLPESPSKLYLPSDRRLSPKLSPTFAHRGCRVVSATDPHDRIFDFLDRSRYFFLQVAPQLYSRGLVDPFQRHCFSENVVVPGIEPGTSGYVATRPQSKLECGTFNLLMNQTVSDVLRPGSSRTAEQESQQYAPQFVSSGTALSEPRYATQLQL
jgi:hypothetical protein